MSNRHEWNPKRPETASKLLAAYGEEERRRVARELHDDIGQRLALLADDADRLRRELQIDDEANRRRLDNLVKQAHLLSDDLRDISHTLHPAILEDLGLVVALRSLTSQVGERTGLGVSFAATDVPQDVPMDVGMAVYRIAQEALRNITKHAGDATACVTLKAHAGELVLVVSDTGSGFDVTARTGLGLTSMRERAYLAGGVLNLVSTVGRGTSIMVCLPLSLSVAN